MIRRRRRRCGVIVTTAAVAPGAAAAVAAMFGASGVTASLIAIGASALGAAAGVVLLRRLWRPVQTQLDAATDLLQDCAVPAGVANQARPALAAVALPTLVRDAFSRHQRECSALGDRLGRLNGIIESLGEPVLAVDRDNVVVFANATACDFFNIELARLVGASAPQVLTQAALLAALDRGLKGEHHTARLDLATHRGAGVWDLVTAPIAMDDHAAGAILILRDVTDLARAARMKTDFVANASHELRTPLAAIRAALDTARLTADDDPKLMRMFIDLTPAHLNRIEEMTRDLIDLSRLESPELRPAPAPMSVEEMRGSLMSLFGEAASAHTTTLDFSLAPELDGFLTDPRLAHLALKNLIDNALKFCRPGSAVRIAGGLCGSPGVGRRARFEVHNDGAGVPLDQQERIFERFYQVDAAKLSLPTTPGARSGAGLGLAIVKHAVGAMDGEVGVDSVYKQGATFWFEIPEITTHA